ncbi:hypothetical protein [Enterococcus sp. S86.2]|uniref:hypothetical protein n=1 Tax=Enterococcus sp. S86.2 TaxID=3031299 RepID=UPI0026F03A88|nr:hypothetical protein [Enterococcus sp. S86.2]
MNAPNLIFDVTFFGESMGYTKEILLIDLQKMGFKGITIHHKMLEEVTKTDEIKKIAAMAQKLGLKISYVIEDELFKMGRLNKRVPHYLMEAKNLGATELILTIGDYSPAGLKALRKLDSLAITITVTNDQAYPSGRLDKIAEFLLAVKVLPINLGYLFNLGNWRFVGEDEQVAVDMLKEYITEIFLQDVTYINELPVITTPDCGFVDWRQVLRCLPANVDIVLSFPTTSLAEIKKVRDLVLEHNAIPSVEAS